MCLYRYSVEGLTRAVSTRNTGCKLFSASRRWIGINTSFWLLCESTSDDAGLEECERGRDPCLVSPPSFVWMSLPLNRSRTFCYN